MIVSLQKILSLPFKKLFTAPATWVCLNRINWSKTNTLILLLSFLKNRKYKRKLEHPALLEIIIIGVWKTVTQKRICAESETAVTSHTAKFFRITEIINKVKALLSQTAASMSLVSTFRLLSLQPTLSLLLSALGFCNMFQQLPVSLISPNVLSSESRMSRFIWHHKKKKIKLYKLQILKEH